MGEFRVQSHARLVAVKMVPGKEMGGGGGGGGFSTVAGSQQENVGASSAVAGVGEGFNNKRSCMKVNTGLDKGVQFSSSCGRDWVTMGHMAQWVTVFLPSKHSVASFL